MNNENLVPAKDIDRKKSSELYAKAVQYFPGGVNSPVRAFKSVHGTPLFIEKGDGCKIWDADGNEFIDFCCSWGPLILGHNHPSIRENILKTIDKGLSFGAPTSLENELAELMLTVNSKIEKIRFVSSGTEAVMSAIRLARGYTGRSKIIKFDGCYHGHSDSLLVKAGSGLVTFGETSSAGVPKAFADETLVLPLNDTQALDEVFKNYTNEIACVIIEGIPANNGLLLQSQEYVEYLAKITKEHGALLIFDEVITGFRLGLEGAAGHYNIQPDILTYGKIIGGGMPVGAYGASKEIMSHISPDGQVYQAGTLSGNPVAMSAGIAQLKELSKEGFFQKLEEKTKIFISIIDNHIQSQNYPIKIYTIGSIFWFAFSNKNIQAANDIAHESMEFYKSFHRELLNRGVYLGPSGYEVGFVSAAHDLDTLKEVAEKMKIALDLVMR